MANYDPGGDPPDSAGLQEIFNQQQAKITALRELVRQSETDQGKKTAFAQEKVRNIAERLTQFKTKTNKSRMSRANSEVQENLLATSINEESSYNTSIDYEDRQPQSLPPPTRGRSETPGSEKFNLLRQQMEQNRQKMAQRECHKREIEVLVTQLKTKFESTQQTLEQSVELGRSTGDLTMLTPIRGRYDFNKSTSDLNAIGGASTPYIPNTGHTHIDLERLRYLEGRVKLLEHELSNKENIPVSDNENVIQDLKHKILDLEENLREKECIIEARTQAVTLVTENISMKGKNTVDLLEDTKQEMYKMQTNFVQAESNLKSELDRLKLELDEKNSKISNLEEMNHILETARYDLTIEKSDLMKKLEDVQEYSTKISELNKLNQSLQHRISDLESQKYEFITQEEVEQAKSDEQEEKYQEFSDKIQELQDQIEQSQNATSTTEKLQSMVETIEAQREEIESAKQQNEELQESLQEKTIELSVLNANFSVLQEKIKSIAPKPLFPKSAEEEAEVETSKLKQQLDDANKSMIKTKLKIKQLQKQVDSFKKTSSVHEEVVRLAEEVQTLTQRLAEAEEDKGNLQLHLVNYDGSLPDSELEKRIKILETTCQNQTSAIQLLEEQKLDINDDLNSTKTELEAIKDHVKDFDQDETGRITTQITSIELEEKFEKCCTDRDELLEQLKALQEDKRELQQKLDCYMVENMELLDKIEKLSLEKVSSAESIEIVENLTQQEKLEIENYQMQEAKEGVDDVDDDDIKVSLAKMTEESSELVHKIELFTNERREVLEKLEALTLENRIYVNEIQALKEDREITEAINENIHKQNVDAIKSLEVELAGKNALLVDLEATNALKAKLQEQLPPCPTTSTHASPVKSAIDKDSFEKTLKAFDTEIQNFNKNKDRNQKNKISKKLSNDAKNIHRMVANLLEEYNRNIEECDQMKVEVTQLTARINSLSAVDHSAEVKLLKEQVIEVTNGQIEKIEQIELLNEELERKREELESVRNEIENEKMLEINEIQSKLEAAVKENEKNRSNQSKLEATIKEIDGTQSKLETANREIDILKTLVNEQKQQLIETYQEHEDEMTSKLKMIQNYENEVEKMKGEIDHLRSQSANDSAKFSKSLSDEIEKLEAIADSQKQELTNKQHTIDALNNQIIDLYKAMEDNSNKIIERDDEIQYLQELLDAKKDEVKMLNEKSNANLGIIENLRKQLSEDDKKVHEAKIKHLEDMNRDLDVKNKEQLDKLKKFAANFKKKAAQCAELEEKLTNVQDMKQKLIQYEEESNIIKRENNKLNANLQQSSSSENELIVLKAENQEFSQKLHHLNIELHKLLQLKYTLESENQSHLSEIQRLEKQVGEVEGIRNELQEKNEEIQHLQNDLKAINDEIQRLQDAVRRSEHNLSQKSEEMNEIQEDLRSKNLKIEKCKAIIKEKNAKLQEFEKKLVSHDQIKAEKDGLNAALQSAKVKNQDLMREKDDLKSALQTAQTRNQELEVKTNELAGALQTAEAQKDELLQHKENINAVYITMEATNNELRRVQGELNKATQTFKARNQDSEAKISHLNAALQATEVRNQELTLKIDQTNAMIQDLNGVNAKNQDLSREKDELKQKLDALDQEKVQAGHFERILKQKEEAIEIVQNNLELMEAENQKLSEKIVKLEDGISYMEERRYSLERQKNLLGSKLEEKVNEFAQNEDVLLQKLTNLSHHDELIEKKLQEKEDEIEELSAKLKDLESTRNGLTAKMTTLENQLKICENKISDMENDHFSLNQQVAGLNNELRKVSSDAEQRITDKDAEIDELEFELSNQLNKIENERKILQETLEKTQDNNIDLQDEVVRLRENVNSLEQIRSDVEKEITWLKLQNDNLTQDSVEMQDLRIQIGQYQSEMENLRTQNQGEMNALKQQIADMEAIRTQLSQHQTDDQVILQNEATKLKEMLVAKETEIQNLQLQMTFSAPSTTNDDPFSSLTRHSDDAKHDVLEEKIRELENDATLKDSKIQELSIERDLIECRMQDMKAKLDELNRRPAKEIIPQPVQENIPAFKTSMFFAAAPPQASAASLFDAFPSADKQALEKLKQQHASDLELIQQLRDDIDILSAKNKCLIEEIEEKSSKLEHLAQYVHKVEEQVEHQPSTTASFFASTAPSQEPIFEDIIVAKKAFDCQPQDVENWGWESMPPNAETEGETQALHDEINELKKKVSRNEEFIQELQDDIDILAKKNRNLDEALAGKAKKLEDMCKLLRECQEKIANFEEVKATTASSFFETSSSMAAPIFEEIIVPKKAYTCQPPLEMEEDCWGAEEAILEEKHQQTSSTVLERKITEKDDLIQELQVERDRLQQEVTDLKVKSGKLLKKVKEYKVKNESLVARSTSVESNDLDLAIQEELNAQIKLLEAKLKEATQNHEKDVAEKDSHLKRIDMLTAANERMMEMKERQDIQMEVHQTRIKELHTKLQQLEEWGDDSYQKESKPEVTGNSQQSLEKDKEINDLKVDNDELQAILEEEKANLKRCEDRLALKDREIEDLIAKIDELSQDSNDIKSSLESLNQQKSHENKELSQKLKDLMDKNTQLSSQIENMRSESIFHNEFEEQVQQLNAQLQYKEAEIVHLNEKIAEVIRDDQTQALVQEILNKNHEISTLKTRLQEVENDKVELENNLSLQLTTKERIPGKEEQLEKLNKELLEEKEQMEQELQVLNDRVMLSFDFEDKMKGTVLELDAKNIEIQALKTSLEQMRDKGQADAVLPDEMGDLKSQNRKLQAEKLDMQTNYQQINAQWGQLVDQRGNDVAESWKQHLQMRESEFSEIEQSLREEINRLKMTDAGEQAAAGDSEDDREVEKMKEALENQEIEIVTLKEQLAIRSAEYARLAAQVDPFAVRHSSNMVTMEPRLQTGPMLDQNSDKVARSELELALYMIYQRDMRCEELELELRNLLEERDGLQLRLSNAIRQAEDFKRKINVHPGDLSGDSTEDISKTTTPEKTLQQIVQESGISAASDTTNLSTKLSELHAVGHTKDKRLQEEREERNRQMTLIQRDLAYMPMEAASKIAGTNLNPTEQSQQSASSVLINWILGKKSDS